MLLLLLLFFLLIFFLFIIIMLFIIEILLLFFFFIREIIIIINFIFFFVLLLNYYCSTHLFYFDFLSDLIFDPLISILVHHDFRGSCHPLFCFHFKFDFNSMSMIGYLRGSRHLY